MLKFFRDIRKQLFGSNRKRYYKYAFGEVVLVCIGVLIALQVNNWNENRKIKDTEHLLLQDLLSEMKHNLEELKIAMDYHAKSREAAKQLLLVYHDKYTPKNLNEVDSLLTLAQWAWTFDPAMGALNAIKLSGHMNSISNAELRKLIATFEDLSEDTQEEGKLLRDIIVNKYIPDLSKYVNLIDRLKYLGEDYEILKGSKFIPDYESLFNDRTIENHLSYMHTWRIDELSEETNLLSVINNFINILETELNND